LPKRRRMSVEPFTIDVPQATLDDLHERLTRIRWPGELDGPGWEDGTRPRWLREVVDRWRSLPGYTFSDPLPGRGSACRMPALWVELMRDVLGYERFAAHGGDIAAMVTNRLAYEFPGQVVGVHVALVAEPYVGPGAAPLTPAERAMRSHARGGPGERRSVRAPPAHPPADAGLRPERLAGRPRGMDPRSLVGLERLRWRSRAAVHQGRAAHDGDALLGHGDDGHVVSRLPRLGARREQPARGLGGSHVEDIRAFFRELR
jgi:hypothetical protein